MWARNGRWILPEMPDFHVAFRNLLHAVNLRHGTDGFTSSPKEGVLRIFSPWKIRRRRPGLNPRTWVPKASTLPLDHRSRLDTLLLRPSLLFAIIHPHTTGISRPAVQLSASQKLFVLRRFVWFYDTFWTVSSGLRSDAEAWIEFLAWDAFVFTLTSLHSATALAKYLALRLSAGTLVSYTALCPFFLSYLPFTSVSSLSTPKLFPAYSNNLTFSLLFLASFKYFLSSSCLINSNHMPQSLQTLIYQIRCFITGGAKAT